MYANVYILKITEKNKYKSVCSFHEYLKSCRFATEVENALRLCRIDWNFQYCAGGLP